MTTYPDSDLLRNATLLVAAIQLRRSHGLLYAMRFLEDAGFSDSVIWELFGLLPADVDGLANPA
jgi:hypothetical protein